MHSFRRKWGMVDHVGRGDSSRHHIPFSFCFGEYLTKKPVPIRTMSKQTCARTSTFYALGPIKNCTESRSFCCFTLFWGLSFSVGKFCLLVISRSARSVPFCFSISVFRCFSSSICIHRGKFKLPESQWKPKEWRLNRSHMELSSTLAGQCRPCKLVWEAIVWMTEETLN